MEAALLAWSQELNDPDAVCCQTHSRMEAEAQLGHQEQTSGKNSAGKLRLEQGHSAEIQSAE